jgi:multicomponent Na+:H+ antiporter subunit F
MIALVTAAVLPILFASLLLALVRLLRGPSLADRVVALDLIAAIGIGVIAAHAIADEQPVFLDVAIILALISFVGTVAFAQYLERAR